MSRFARGERSLLLVGCTFCASFVSDSPPEWKGNARFSSHVRSSDDVKLVDICAEHFSMMQSAKRGRKLTSFESEIVRNKVDSLLYFETRMTRIHERDFPNSYSFNQYSIEQNDETRKERTNLFPKRPV